MSEKFENINGHKKKREKIDNNLHNSTEKTKDLKTGIQQQKRDMK